MKIKWEIRYKTYLALLGSNTGSVRWRTVALTHVALVIVVVMVMVEVLF